MKKIISFIVLSVFINLYIFAQSPVDSLLTKMNVAQTNNDWNTAADCARQIYNIVQTPQDKELAVTFIYNALFPLTKNEFENKNYEKAIELAKEALKYDENEAFQGMIVLSYCGLANKYRDENNFVKAHEYGLLAQQSAKSQLYVDNANDNRAVIYMYQGRNEVQHNNIDEAQRLFEESIKLSTKGSKTYLQANSLMGQLFSKRRQLQERIDKTSTKIIDYSLNAQKYYLEAGKISNAFEEVAYEARVYSENNNTQKAMELLNDALRQCQGKDEMKKAKLAILRELGNIEIQKADYNNALIHTEELYHAHIDNEDYVQAYNATQVLLNIYTFHIKDAQKQKLWKEQQELCKNHDEETKRRIEEGGKTTNGWIADTRIYGEAVKEYSKGNAQKAIDILNPLIERVEKDESYPLYCIADYKMARSLAYAHLDSAQMALKDVNDAILLYETDGHNKNLRNLSTAWQQKTSIDNRFGNKDALMDDANNYLETTKQFYGDNHRETIEAMHVKAICLTKIGKTNEALDILIQCEKLLRQDVVRHFAYLTADERTSYWLQWRKDSRDVFSYASVVNEAPEEMADLMFNQQLLEKGLLITTESKLQKAVFDDNNLKKDYDKIRQLYVHADNPNNSIESRNNAIIEAAALERTLAQKVSAFNSFTDFLNVDINMVKGALKNEDAAIEFVEYNAGNKVVYAAIVLSPQWQHAKFVKLFDKDMIKREDGYVWKQAFEYIWKPIIQQLPNVTNIYFAPAGELYTLPIESCQELYDDNLNINIYRLSSTRQLCINKSELGHGTIAYGGLDYDASVNDLIDDAKIYEKQKAKAEENKTENTRTSSSKLLPLDGTLKELNKLADIIKKTDDKSLEINVYKGNKGTETSFKSLDNSKARLIHIGTHGFYNKPIEGDVSDNEALNRCGIYFAGANQTVYYGEVIPDNIDDGIMTANEIAQMHFNGLDMVVLSACETGLGNISGDGVFGLQRGFKKAGANSILMSLWKVNDEATAKLIEEFYSNWITNKMSKHKALEEAKKTVRNTPGWENPKFWAAFILLDAVQ